MAKFLHTGDLHFGESRYLANYLNRQVFMMDEIFRVAQENQVTAVLICGDLWHRKDTSAKERDALLDRLIFYSKLVEIFIIPGNHDDLGAGYNQIHFLTILAQNKKLKNITITEQPKLAKVGDQDIIMIPCGKYTSGEFNDIVTKLLKKCTSKPIVMAHELIHGSATDVGHKSTGGVKIDTSLPVLAWLFGDVHKYQRLADNAWYSGAPMQHNFGDYLPKGVVILDTEKPTEPEFISLDRIPPFIVIEGVPDVLPEAACIKLLVDSKAVLQRDLPSHVFPEYKDNSQTDPNWQAQVAQSEEYDILAGLETLLLAKGVSETLIPLAMAEAADIRKTVGV